ncbi:hypothetical protein GCM10023191_000540 [Actinoallomurus oryzae]|uniref:Uncharacterized protein n=1 Tax=Actinoallomurus oryzae TaxID=502180 RepID=A0ABP8P6W1_9ACTN
MHLLQHDHLRTGRVLLRLGLGGLGSRTQYTVKIDNPADYQDCGPLYGSDTTKPGAGGNTQIDSNGKTPTGSQCPPSRWPQSG